MANHTLITLDNETPTRITPSGLHSGMDITIQNVDTTGIVYLGGTDEVSDSDYGFRLKPEYAWSVELSGRDAIYAIASAPNTTIAVFIASLETGN